MPAAASPVSARSKQLLPAPTNSAGLQQKCVPASLGSVWLSVAAPARPADGSLVSGGSWLAPFSTIGRRQTLQQSGAQPLRAHCSRCGCLQSGSLVFSAVATRICSRQPRQWPGPTHPATATWARPCWLAEQLIELLHPIRGKSGYQCRLQDVERGVRPTACLRDRVC